MIKAPEVRIGNYVLWNPRLVNAKSTLPSERVEVASVSADKIGYFSPTVEHRAEPFEDDILQTETPHKPLEEFEPLPLTAEILQNLPVKLFSFTENIIVSLEPDGIYIEGAEGRKSLQRIQHVHQLQNLYFDLTGEELDIRL